MIIAVVGQKGGAGKTTTAINIADCLRLRGRSVLLVDADIQKSARMWAEVAVDEGHETPTVIGMGAEMAADHQLPRLAQNYDHVIIDCPGRHGATQAAALMICDLALLPVQPSGMDLRALGQSLALVSQAQILRPHLKSVGLITFKTRTLGTRDASSVLEQYDGLDMLKTQLSFLTAYRDSYTAGLSVKTYDPSGKASKEVDQLTTELLALFSKHKTAMKGES